MQMFSVAFGFVTRLKTILLLINRLINEVLLVAECWPRFNQMLLQLIDVPHWSPINMFLRVGFSWCLQALVHWCGFHAVRGESEWCILLWCLAAQTVAAKRLSRCWQFLLSSAPRVTRALSCCDTRLRTSRQTWPANRPDLSFVDYRLLTVIQECVFLKQQGMPNIVDELWLLTEWLFY